MLWSIDSCQNKVSADQYHRPIEIEYFLKLSTDKLLVFSNDCIWCLVFFIYLISCSWAQFMQQVSFSLARLESNSGAPRARVWAEPHSLVNLPIPENLVITCQNRASADQYHLTVPRAQVSIHRRRIFLKFSADKLPVSNDRRLKFIFSKDSYQICCVYVTVAPHY